MRGLGLGFRARGFGFRVVKKEAYSDQHGGFGAPVRYMP